VVIRPVFDSPLAPVTANPNALPGSAAITQLLSGLTFWAFLAAVLGMLLGAAMWAVGHHSSNYQQAANGRRGVIVSGFAALIVGAAPALVSFFFTMGQGVR